MKQKAIDFISSGLMLFHLGFLFTVLAVWSFVHPKSYETSMDEFAKAISDL